MYIPLQHVLGITDDTSFVYKEGIREYFNSTSFTYSDAHSPRDCLVAMYADKADYKLLL